MPAPPGIVMVSPPEVRSNAEGAPKRRPRPRGVARSAAKGIIEAGAPAFGCTVHPLRLQAPPPLTRTRAPARAIVQRHPVGREEGTVGRASRARLSTPRPLTPLLSGTCLTSSGRPPLREMLATKGPGCPEGYPDPGRLGSCMSYRGRQSEGPEPSRLESSDPMREAGAPSTGGWVVPAPPGVVILAPLGVLRNAERAQSEGRVVDPSAGTLGAPAG